MRTTYGFSRGGGDSAYERGGDVPKGVNFGFWSHLGCSGQNAIIFRREGLVTFRVAREKYKNMYVLSVF